MIKSVDEWQEYCSTCKAYHTGPVPCPENVREEEDEDKTPLYKIPTEIEEEITTFTKEVSGYIKNQLRCFFLKGVNEGLKIKMNEMEE